MTHLALQMVAWWRGNGFNHIPEHLRLGDAERAMRLEKREAAFLIVLMWLALEAAVTPGPAAAEEIKRLEEHAGVRKAEAENISNNNAIWVTSPWKLNYLGYIG